MGWVWIVLTILVVAGLYVFFRTDHEESAEGGSMGDQQEREVEHDFIDNDRHY